MWEMVNFSKWELCEDNESIRYQKIVSDDPEELLYHFYLPKGTILDIKKREYAGCILCLSGRIDLFVENDVVELRANLKKCLESDVYHGKVLRDSYVVTHALPLP